MGSLFNIVLTVVFFWGVGKIFAPLFDTGHGTAHYMGSLIGWCIAVLFFGWLFGIF
jgi:hypothetical protein